MDILIKCLAFIGAVSLLGSLLFVFLALRFAKETPTTYHSELHSTSKPQAGTIITLDSRRKRKDVDLPARLELSQRRGQLKKRPETGDLSPRTGPGFKLV